MARLTEIDVEAAALKWLATLGWQVVHGPNIASDKKSVEAGKLWAVCVHTAASGCNDE